MEGYSGIQLGQQQGYVGKTGYTGSTNTSQGVDVSKLQAGDTFRGEIASVNGEDVQILLTNGQYMSARLERDVQIALGQMLNLQVQSNKDNKIVLKPLYDNNSQLIRVGEAALRAANISVNEKNLNLVANLLQNGMSIDKNTITAYNRLALQNPQADISEIIELNKLKLPVNEENLNQLQNYENLQHKLIDGVNETADEVVKLFETLTGGGEADGTAPMLSTPADTLAVADKFMEKVIELLSEDEPELPQNSGIADSTNADTSANGISSGADNSKEASVNINTKSDEVQTDGKAVTENAKMADTAKVTENIADTENSVNTPNLKNVPHETISDIDKQNIDQTDKNINNNEKASNGSQLSDISKELSNKPASEITDKITKYISEGKLDLKDVKQLLKEGNVGQKLDDTQKAQLFKSEPFKELVKKEFVNRWTLTPDTIAKEGKVEEFYEKLARETSRLSKLMDETLTQSGTDPSSVQTKAASNMNENIEFMNQVNHMMNYVQLPLKLSDSQAHGDLYVYANKKNMARNDGMLTAFMHLDMDNLGSLDVSIALETSKNQVTTKFYLDEEVIPLLNEHKDELIERLAKKGYNCKTFLLEKDEDKSVVDHLEEQVSGQSALMGYRTFDTRA